MTTINEPNNSLNNNRKFPNDRRIPNILKLKTEDPAVKRYCIALLEAAGSFAYTRMVLTELDSRLRRDIAALQQKYSSRLHGGIMNEMTSDNEILLGLLDRLKIDVAASSSIGNGSGNSSNGNAVAVGGRKHRCPPRSSQHSKVEVQGKPVC